MQTAATNSLVLTDFSSLERFADSQTEISYSGFYQLIADLITGVYKKQVFHELGDKLVLLAEHAHAFRQMDMLEQISQILVSVPLASQYESVGQYYQAVTIQRFGRGDIDQAASLLERVAEYAPPRYRVRAMISLGANSHHQCDNRSALSLYCEASRFASRNALYDPYATLHTQRMVGVINALEGNHRNALAVLENLFPLAHAMRSSQPHVYCDYMNSLAVELCEVGRLEEAKNVSQIVVASPFASAYPEWRETREEIELRGWRASRSTVGVTQTSAVTQKATETNNLLTLPTVRRDSPATAPSAEPQPLARVIKFPSRTPTMSEQNDKEQLDPSEKRRIVADKLYEMFMANLEDRPIDIELVEKLYRVFLEKRKRG